MSPPGHAISTQTPSPFAVDMPSMRPVAADVGHSDALDIPTELRPNRRKTVVIVAIALGAVLGVGLALGSVSGAPSDAPAAVAVDSTLPPVVAAAPAPRPATPPPAVAAVAAAPAAPATTGGSAGANPAAPATAGDARLTSDQRKALLDADKAKTNRRTRTAPTHGARTKNVFHKGGAKFDPLNASL